MTILSEDQIVKQLQDYSLVVPGSTIEQSHKKATEVMINTMLLEIQTIKQLDKTNTRLTIALWCIGIIMTIVGIVIPVLFQK